MYRLNCSYVIRGLGAGAMAFLLVVPSIGAQQGGTVTGRILDARTGAPLAAAQIFISALDLGGLTQQNGRYLLQNVPAGTHTLTVARIGYRTVDAQVLVGGGQTVEQNFDLAEEALALDEIIVTGTPGGTQRRAIGNTVQQVDASVIAQDVAITNFQDLLTARSTGLRFTARVGSVGAGGQIMIRGAGSFDNERSEPLIYVDGIRVNNSSQVGPATGEGRLSSALNDFNPEDVESIEIIKGPAAASLYGTEASAGVIQIITKRGQQGAPQFNVSVRQGVNWLPNPAGQVGTQWTCPTDSSPGPVECENEADLVSYNMYDESTRYIREGYFDWPTPNLYQYGHSQSYNVDVRGGAESIRYFLSANVDDEEGIVWFNTNEVVRLRANIGLILSENLSLDVSTGYTDGDTRYALPVGGDGGIWQDLLWSNGFFLDRVTPFSDIEGAPRTGGYQEHLPTDVAEVEATRDFARFTGSATMSFNIDDFSVGRLGTLGISQRLVAGIDRGWDVNREFYPLEDGIVPEHLTQFTDEWDNVFTETLEGELVYERPIQTNTSLDYSLTADLNVNETWRFRTSAGVQYYVDKRDFFSNSGNGFASTLSTTINQISQSQIRTSFELIENKSLGFYVQEEVGWNDRLFVTGAVRFDDNSTFGVDAPAQRYPKVSGTWVISEEAFWNFDFVSSLRLRGAWGKAGRQPNSTSSQNIYIAIPGPGGAAAIRPESPGNPGIEPEVSTEIELGFDFAILDDRISGQFTNYQRKDEQALLGVDIDPSFGFPGSVQQNVGRIDNWGWEALLSARLYESGSLTFDLDLTADYTNNEIKSLGNFPGSERIRIGYPYPNYIVDNLITRAEFDPAGEYANVFNRNLNGWCDPGVPTGPTSQHGLVPGGDEVPCQDAQNPIILAGGAFVNHTFTVAPRVGLLGGDLQIFALAEGQYGRTHQDRAHLWSHAYRNSMATRLENIPTFALNERINGNSPAWGKGLFKADFWKLREVGARYTVPESLVQKIGGERASFSFSARNLWTIWRLEDNLTGVVLSDPETGDPGDLDSGGVYSTPPMASVHMTVRIAF